MTQGFLGMSDDDFWRDPEARVDDAMRAWGTKPGIALDGPAKLRLAEHTTLPLAGLRGASVKDARELDLHRMAMIAATWLETGETRVGSAFYVRRASREPFDPAQGRPDNDEREGEQRDEYPDATLVDAFSLELCDRLRSLTLRPGTLVTRLFVHDRASNPVVTRLTSHTTRDPEVVAYLGRHSRPAYPLAVSPRPNPLDYVSYEQEAHSPEPPDGLGINLKVNRIVVREQAPRILLRAAFRLEAPGRDLVKPQPPGWRAEVAAADPTGATWHDVGYERATAVLPMTILALGDQLPDPVVIEMQVPVRSPVEEGSEKATVRGHFNLDLAALSGELRRCQTYAIWVIYRSLLAGPALMALVSEDMLPEAGR